MKNNCFNFRMNNEFISWDELNLDDVLGEWTDENDEVLGPQSEWDFSTDNELPAVDVANDDVETKKENTPKPKKPRNSTEKKHFFCPLCTKSYLSTAGFRGHVIKKHDRPDLKGKLKELNSYQIMYFTQQATVQQD